MSRLVEPSFSDKADRLKVWIFAEDLSRELEASGLGFLPMREADAVKNFLRIRDFCAFEL
jgi:hypothetical protein